MPLKIALVGCGKIADGHVEEINKLGSLAYVAAVCDLEALMAEQVAVRYKVPAYYDNLGRMLEVERPDVVHVTTPPASHINIAKQVIDAGCHVFVEKPFALNYADACALVDYAESAGRKLTVGYSYLFDPPARRMRELVAAGVIGDVVHVESFYGYNLSGPFGGAIMSDPTHWVHSLPGGLLQNNIDHMLYKITEFVADERPHIHAAGSIKRHERYGDARDSMLDELRVLVQGETTSAYATFSSHVRPPAHFARVYGSKNTVHVDYAARTVTVESVGSLPGAFGRLTPPFQQAKQYAQCGVGNLKKFARSDFQYFDGLNHLIAAFYKSIQRNEAPPIAYRDIKRIAWIMDEIFRQVNSRQNP